MRKNFKSEKGITLVELLAVIAIGGIISVLIMGILGNGQNQYNSQTVKSEQLNDIRYAAKVITKEIRKAERVEVSTSILKLGVDSPIVFTFSNEEILKNGITLVSGISDFSILKNNRTLTIKIVSTENKGDTQKVETEIFIREGVIYE